MANYNDVNAAWILEKIEEFEIKNPRQLAIDSGVSYASLNRWLSGGREVSSEGKKAFWWYFKYLDVMRILEQTE